jgi:hypothetical protein
VLPLAQLPAEPSERNQPLRHLFGRNALLPLGLTDSGISQRHFTVWRRGDQHGSQVFVEDLGSKNGTHVDGDQLPFDPKDAPGDLQEDLQGVATNQAEIRDGAVLRCGKTILIFRQHFPKDGVVEGPLAGVTGETLVSPFGLGRLRRELKVLERDYRGSSRLGRLNILLQAETGCGKELLASHVAERLGRSSPFRAVNVTTIPATLLSSELFGIESLQGAQRSPGLVGVSNKGTLFLDEIHLLDPSVQRQLLRFLESRDYQRIGGTDTLVADVLVLTATSQDLKQFVGDDLRSRLEYIKLEIPPLRDRTEDIPELCKEFLLRRGMSTEQVENLPVEVELMEALLLHPWASGNARELRNTLDKLLRVAGGSPELRYWAWKQLRSEEAPRPTLPRSLTLQRIFRALQETKQGRSYNFSEAARLLSMDDSTLKRRIGRL